MRSLIDDFFSFGFCSSWWFGFLLRHSFLCLGWWSRFLYFLCNIFRWWLRFVLLFVFFLRLLISRTYIPLMPSTLMFSNMIHVNHWECCWIELRSLGSNRNDSYIWPKSSQCVTEISKYRTFTSWKKQQPTSSFFLSFSFLLFFINSVGFVTFVRMSEINVYNCLQFHTSISQAICKPIHLEVDWMVHWTV